MTSKFSSPITISSIIKLTIDAISLLIIGYLPVMYVLVHLDAALENFITTKYYDAGFASIVCDLVPFPFALIWLILRYRDKFE